MMTPTELLKPRYEVIADYPGQLYQIGDIIDTYETAMCYAIGNTPHCEPEWSEKVCLSDYPKIFRPLAWYEHRNPEDMPEYVKDKSSGKVYKVADPSQNHRIWHVDGEIEHRFITRSWYIPATETEYQEYLKTKV